MKNVSLHVVSWTDPEDGLTETALCDSKECADHWIKKLSKPSYCRETGEKIHNGIEATSFSRPIQSMPMLGSKKTSWGV